jgi:hypothetical protein
MSDRVDGVQFAAPVARVDGRLARRRMVNRSNRARGI